MKRTQRTLGLMAVICLMSGMLAAFGCSKEAGVNTDNTPPTKTAEDEGKKQAAGQEQQHKQTTPPGQTGQ